MKKLILKNILIAIIAFIVLGTNSIYASMADYTDEEADAQTKKSQQEWKEEQKEIVDYLNGKIPEMDRLIEKKEQFLVELENYKKSMIYEYVTGKKEVPQS